MKKYLKFNALEDGCDIVHCITQEFDEESKRPRQEIVIPLAKFLEVEKEFDLLKGSCYSIYIEERPGRRGYYEKQFLDGSSMPLNKHEITVCKIIVDNALIERKYDDLTKPPSSDEQVEEFIKSFFEETEEPIEQRNLLAEFFEELEQSESSEEESTENN